MKLFYESGFRAALIGVASFIGLMSFAMPAAAQTMLDPVTIPCTACHDGSTLIVSKQAQLARSPHGSGHAYERGTNKDCAGCHGSEAAEARIAAGQMPHDESIAGVVNVSPYTCRTCHDIHESYTLDDFAVVGEEAAVELETSGTIYDGGAGNLCANCHQVRVAVPEATEGDVEITSSRFGPHHGVEAQMQLGEGGAGGLRSRPSVHYKEVGDTCVDCHMGPLDKAAADSPLPALNRNHTFEPQVAYCTVCHREIEDFDYRDVQTETTALIDEVKALLIAKGIMDSRPDMENRSVPGTYPAAIVNAYWNYMMVVEDGSKGAHNSDWARKLLESARDALQG